MRLEVQWWPFLFSSQIPAEVSRISRSFGTGNNLIILANSGLTASPAPVLPAQHSKQKRLSMPALQTCRISPKACHVPFAALVQALKVAQSAMKAAPHSAHGLVMMGRVQAAMGSPCEAQRSYEDAVRSDPKCMEASIALADIHRTVRRPLPSLLYARACLLCCLRCQGDDPSRGPTPAEHGPEGGHAWLYLADAAFPRAFMKTCFGQLSTCQHPSSALRASVIRRSDCSFEVNGLGFSIRIVERLPSFLHG